MAIRLGTVAPIGFNDFPPAEWLACFRELGCQTVQAYRNQEAGLTLPQMKDAIAAGGMPCDSIHGIYGEEFDPSAPDEEARRFAVDTFKSEGDLALELGGPLVVVHCATIREDGISADERATGKGTAITALVIAIPVLGLYAVALVYLLVQALGA